MQAQRLHKGIASDNQAMDEDEEAIRVRLIGELLGWLVRSGADVTVIGETALELRHLTMPQSGHWSNAT